MKKSTFYESALTKGRAHTTLNKPTILTGFMVAHHVSAGRPEDLGRFFMERGNAGDVEGLVALYEPDAVLAFPRGKVTVGRDEIRRVYVELLATKPKFQGDMQPALRNGDFALTLTRFSGGATAEVAHRQPDGTWLWIIDQPNVLK